MMENLPTKGFGTFIGIEHNPIHAREERLIITQKSILSALSIGYRHFDLAQNYGNLQAVREAFEEAFKSKDEGGLGLKREDVWITMKGNVSSEEELNLLLQETGLTYFNLYLVHHPVSPENLIEKWRMLSTVPAQIIQHKGVSNCYLNYLIRLLECCEREGFEKPYANEIEINLFNQEHELVNYCATEGIKIIAYSPLAYNMSSFLPDFDKEIRDLGLDCTNKQLILAWLLSRGICVIPSSRDPGHQMENFAIDHLIGAFDNKDLLLKMHEYETGDPVTSTALEFKEASRLLASNSSGPRW